MTYHDLLELLFHNATNSCKQLDEKYWRPLCQASMYWVEAEQYEQELNFHQCSHCEHRIFKIANNKTVIAQAVPTTQKIMAETRCKNNKKFKKQDAPERELNQLRFIDKLFLLSILDQHAQEHIPHEEFIDWEKSSI